MGNSDKNLVYGVGLSSQGQPDSGWDDVATVHDT